MVNFLLLYYRKKINILGLIPLDDNMTPSPPVGQKVHACTHDLLLSWPEELKTFLYFPNRNLHPQKSLRDSPLFTYQGIELRDFAMSKFDYWALESLRLDGQSTLNFPLSELSLSRFHYSQY